MSGEYYMKKIKELAIKLRSAIDSAKSDDKFMADQCFINFPEGCCGITSELLARFLIDNGVDETIICMYGTYYDDSLGRPSHSWLRINNDLIVDITGDQFKFYPRPINFNESVYVGPYTRFHRSFEITAEEQCNNYFPLDDTYIRSHLSRKKLYDIILEYID